MFHYDDKLVMKFIIKTVLIFFFFSTNLYADWVVFTDTKQKVWKNSDYENLYLTEAAFFKSEMGKKKQILNLFNIREWKIDVNEAKFIAGTYFDRNNKLNYFFESKEQKSIHIVTTEVRWKRDFQKICASFKKEKR